jgi:hypothetical protein
MSSSQSTLFNYYQTIIGLMYTAFPLLDDEEKIHKAMDKFTPFLDLLSDNERSCFGRLNFPRFADHFQLFLRLVDVVTVPGKNYTFDGLIHRIEKATALTFKCHCLMSNCFHSRQCIADTVYPDGKTYDCDCKMCIGSTDISVCDTICFLIDYTNHLSMKIKEQNDFELNPYSVSIKEQNDNLQAEKRKSQKRDSKRFDAQKNPEKKIRRNDRVSFRKITKAPKSNRFDLSVY